MTRQHIRTTYFHSGPAIISLKGDFDLADQAALREALREALCLSPDLILDMGEVTFVDSSVVATLLDGQERAKLLGGSLVLAGPSAIVRKIIRLSRIGDVMHTTPSLGQAVRLPRGRSGTSSQ